MVKSKIILLILILFASAHSQVDSVQIDSVEAKYQLEFKIYQVAFIHGVTWAIQDSITLKDCLLKLVVNRYWCAHYVKYRRIDGIIEMGIINGYRYGKTRTKDILLHPSVKDKKYLWKSYTTIFKKGEQKPWKTYMKKMFPSTG